jgi:hypothetical protein
VEGEAIGGGVIGEQRHRTAGWALGLLGRLRHAGDPGETVEGAFDDQVQLVRDEGVRVGVDAVVGGEEASLPVEGEVVGVAEARGVDA